MIALFSVLLVVIVSLLVTRVATVALTLTGMSREMARFQARSALSGTGFTTSESEAVVNHPVRRRIVMALMVVGSGGVVTAAATLIISFSGAGHGQAIERASVLVPALLVVYLVSRSRWVDSRLSTLIGRALDRFTDLEARDYAGLLHLGGDYGVSEVAIREGDWLASGDLASLNLRREGVVVLGIERRDGSYEGAPAWDTHLEPGDVAVLYGRRERVCELDDRPAGPAGEAAHDRAVAEAHLPHRPDGQLVVQ